MNKNKNKKRSRKSQKSSDDDDDTDTDDRQENEQNEGTESKEETPESRIDQLKVFESRARESEDTLTQFLAIPQIRKVVELLDEDQDFDIIPKGSSDMNSDESGNNKDNDNDIDIDSLSNSQFLKVLENRFNKALDVKLTEQLKPVEENFKKTDQFMQNAHRQKFNSELVQLKEKYDGVDKYINDMTALHKRAPGLTLEELYVQSVFNKTKDLPPRRQTDSEKPSASSGPRTVKLDGSMTSGRNGFTKYLRETMDKIDLDI